MAITTGSFKKRYFYKLLTNLIAVPISLVTQAIIPRGLGPSTYGSFTFLTNFFQQVVTFFDSGSSFGFYTKLSQRQKDNGLIFFYIIFAAFVTFSLTVFVLIFFLLKFNINIWPGQRTKFIWLAIIWALLTWYTQIMLNIIDAYGLTVKGELVRITQKVIGLMLISFMFWAKFFQLTQFFIYNYIILILLLTGWYNLLKKQQIVFVPNNMTVFATVKKYSIEFYKYSAPLFTYTAVGLIAGLFDRWLLQLYAGSIQQGYYGLSYQIGAICFIFTSAMTPLIMREYSIAFGEQNKEKMQQLFLRFIPMLYSIAAVISIFLFLQADKISLIFGGDQFRNANTAIAIMAFYPIHQTYGQLSGSIFYATDQTKLYRNIACFTILAGLPITFFLIAPKHLFGLDLGSTGLAIKMVSIQFIGVNIQLWYNCRYLHLSFKKLFSHQFLSVLLFLIIGYTFTSLVDHFVNNYIISFLISGVLYALGVLVILLTIPSIFSISKEEIGKYFFLRWTKAIE